MARSEQLSPAQTVCNNGTPLMPLLTIALVAAAMQQPAKVWPQQRFGKSGLVLRMPEPPKVEGEGDVKTYSAKVESVELTVVARPDTESDRPEASALFSDKFRSYRTQFGRKIKSVLNESPVIEAYICGSDDSIGFVLETSEGKNMVVAWQYVRVGGFRYEISARCDRGHQSLLERILGSAWYVDPQTGQLPVLPIGGIGLQSMLGRAFMPKDEATSLDRATVLSMQTDIVPCVAAAGKFSLEELDFRAPDKFKEGLAKFLAGYVQGAKTELEVTRREDGYDISGSVTVQAIKIELIGTALVSEQHVSVVVALPELRDPEAMPFAKQLIRSVSLVPAN